MPGPYQRGGGKLQQKHKHTKCMCYIIIAGIILPLITLPHSLRVLVVVTVCVVLSVVVLPEEMRMTMMVEAAAACLGCNRARERMCTDKPPYESSPQLKGKYHRNH